MNIARFTFSLALLGSIVTPAVAHKKGCSHDCKHESLHPTNTPKKSTSSHVEQEATTTKKVELAESKIDVAQTFAEPVTVTTVSAPVDVIAKAPITPAQPAPTIEAAPTPEVVIAQAPEVVVAAVEIKEEAPQAIEIKEETIELHEEVIKTASTENTLDEATQHLTPQEKKERRLLLADVRPEDLEAIDDIASLLEEDELTLSMNDTQANADLKTAAILPAQETETKDAQQEINNLTQVMI